MDKTEIEESENKLTAKDYATDQDVRWCPGCGDYSILKQVQTVLVDLQLPREDVVFISGIGCSSRFPYYMDTYGMHSIHGRAPAIATGLKISRPELSVWIITGDGDGLSIGGNHFIHMLRRNLDVNLLLFNNEIYGLTKGQYSPTSPIGTINKTSPLGSVDNPFNPLALALGSNSTFVARTMDRDPKHIKTILHQANLHKGSSFIEIYQNCNVFNDGAFFTYTDKATKKQTTLFLEEGQPLVFGIDDGKGIVLDGHLPKVVTIGDEYSLDDLWVHDSSDFIKATILSRFFETPSLDAEFPRPFGVFYQTQRPSYDQLINSQEKDSINQLGKGDLVKLLAGNDTWQVK